MRVGNLQAYLKSLRDPLQASGCSAKTLGDIEAAAASLEPFAELDLGQLAELLVQSRTYRDTGVLPVPAKRATRAKAAAPKADLATLMPLVQRIRALEEKAAAPETPLDDVESESQGLGLTKYKKDELILVAKELGAAVDGKTTKDGAIRKIRLQIMGRRDAIGGTGVLIPTPPPAAEAPSFSAEAGVP